MQITVLLAPDINAIPDSTHVSGGKRLDIKRVFRENSRALFSSLKQEVLLAFEDAFNVAVRLETPSETEVVQTKNIAPIVVSCRAEYNPSHVVKRSALQAKLKKVVQDFIRKHELPDMAIDVLIELYQ